MEETCSSRCHRLEHVDKPVLVGMPTHRHEFVGGARHGFALEIGDIEFPHRALEDYTVSLSATVERAAIVERGFKLVVDYGFGAASFVMPNVLGKLGADVLAINHKLLHGMTYDKVAGGLSRLGIEGGAAFWDAVRDNLQTLKDAREWWDVVQGPLSPTIENAPFTEQAGGLLPQGPFSEATWGEWTAAVSAKTGAKGKALFMPLRLALTGRAHGPEMKKLLPLIGPERARKRLAGQAA